MELTQDQLKPIQLCDKRTCQVFSITYLSSVGKTYKDFCNIVINVTKKNVARDRRNINMPCWNVKCEDIYQMFLLSSEWNQSSMAATVLLSRRDKKLKDQWSESYLRLKKSYPGLKIVIS